VITVALALVVFVSVWTPWTFVSQDASFGSSTSMSPNGFTTIPTSCFITCSDGHSSAIAYLLLIAAAVTALVGLIWLMTRDPILSRTAVVLAGVMLLLAALNAGYLLLATAAIIANYTNTTLLPHVGAGLSIMAAAGATVSALVGAIAERRLRTRLGLPPR
jgi:hypothetical protein